MVDIAQNKRNVFDISTSVLNWPRQSKETMGSSLINNAFDCAESSFLLFFCIDYEIKLLIWWLVLIMK
jgi:hypothetical protein